MGQKMALGIETGEPSMDGRYLCYTDNEFLPAFTEPKILMRYKNEWFHEMSDQRYRGRVFGWVRIPVRKVQSFTAQEYDL